MAFLRRSCRLFAVGLAPALAGCERVVSIDLSAGAPQLVVEARLARVQGSPSGHQRFTLTTSEGFLESAPPPPARGAIVNVTDDLGRVTPFAESRTEPGIYETNALVGEVGRRYTLTVDYEGERYVASDTLLEAPPIDSLRVESKVSAGDTLLWKVTVVFHDPPGVKNFYQWDAAATFSGGGVRVTHSSRDAAADDLYDGRSATEELLNFTDVARAGQVLTVMVRQTALSELAFRYYIAAIQEQPAASPIAVPVANIRGNVANVTVPAHRALGYFLASDVAEIQRRVP